MVECPSLKSRLIAVNRFYWPDLSATSQIVTDMATHMAGQGMPTYAITSRVSYDQQTDGEISNAPRSEVKDGVEIRRVRSTRFGNRSLLGRLSDYLTFYPAATLEMLRLVRKDDVILAKTDPPLIASIAMSASSITVLLNALRLKLLAKRDRSK